MYMPLYNNRKEIQADLSKCARVGCACKHVKYKNGKEIQTDVLSKHVSVGLYLCTVVHCISKNY